MELTSRLCSDITRLGLVELAVLACGVGFSFCAKVSIFDLLRYDSQIPNKVV